MMKPADLNGRILEVPIIQGGMGVGVSLSSLAGHVMKEGGMGVISAALSLIHISEPTRQSLI